MDGVARAQTKAAYVRLQSGCSKLAPRFEELRLHTAEGHLTGGAATGDKLPSRRETQEIQGQLREVGFYPGPMDGIFGSRTRSALRKFKDGCLMAKEFKEILNETLPAIDSETADTRPQKLSISSSKAEARVTRSADDYQASVVQAVQAREQVRVLQLRLRHAGFDPGQVDGLMGPKTKSALAQYEASRAGEKTKASLSNRASAASIEPYLGLPTSSGCFVSELAIQAAPASSRNHQVRRPRTRQFESGENFNGTQVIDCLVEHKESNPVLNANQKSNCN